MVKSADSANSFMYRMTATPGSGVGVSFSDWFNTCPTSNPFGLGQWYHVASVLDASGVKFYVNGARIDSIGVRASPFRRASTSSISRPERRSRPRA